MSDEVQLKNRLNQCSSPYLQQHADNPVAWQPWDEEALRLARELNRPILLSIGYSACHWCHVMAHESFEDPEIAELMNEHFINIKVDREERPDLDQIYQLCHQIFNERSGGWPLTAFLAPDQRPFYMGTYFPNTPKYGLPGFKQVLTEIARFFRENRESVEQNGEVATAALSRLDPLPSEALSDKPITRLREDLGDVFDAEHGGWGEAPKFPPSTDLEFCTRRAALDQDAGAYTMVEKSLQAMVDGGLFDHLGGGFFRYCVDSTWTIPHFEKMLYDNAQLLERLCDAYTLTANCDFETAARATANWALREMQDPAGGFYASVDADIEGQEGGHYLWSLEEVTTLLSPEELEVVQRYYGLSQEGNFEGYNHLQKAQPLTAVAQELGLTEQEAEARLHSARATLWSERNKRTWPERDEKVLTAWNGLMIQGLARAGRVLDSPHYTHAAAECIAFVRDQLWDGERLLAVYKEGQAHQSAYLDDHALVLNGVLEQLQTQWDSDYLTFAQGLAESLLNRFEDPEMGGFYLTAHDQEALIYRPKMGYDHSLPSGNGAAARGLLALGHLLGEGRYLTAAENTVKLFMSDMKAHPAGCASLILALEDLTKPPTLVTLRGGETALQWRAYILSGYQPQRQVYYIPEEEAEELPAVLASRRLQEGEDVTAYVCRGTRCTAPITRWEKFERALSKPPGSRPTITLAAR